MSPQERADLVARGHTLEPLEQPFGNMQAIYWDKGSNRVQAASDPRGIGRAQILEPSPVPPPGPDQGAANPSHGSAGSELYSGRRPGS